MESGMRRMTKSTRPSQGVVRESEGGTWRALRSRLPMSSRPFAFLGLLFVATSGEAQQGADYYAARLTAHNTELLRKVENAHIPPATRKLQAGSYWYAIGDVEFILRYFPNHPYALALLSELCDVRWKVPRCDSEEWFRKAIAINPSAPQTFLANGVHLQRRSRLPEAIQSYKRAIALDPRLGNAHYNLALAYFDQRQYDLANRHAQLAYATGMSLPGLRDKLTQAGHWKPMPPEQIELELAPRRPEAAAPSAN